MAITERYCDCDLATGLNDGTSEANAWQTLAAASNTTTGIQPGERCNIKRTSSPHDPGAHVTFSKAATVTAPVHLRGYTSTIGDGGLFQCHFSSATYKFAISGHQIIAEGLDIKGSRAAVLLDITGKNATVYRSIITTDSSTGQAVNMLYANILNSHIVGEGSSSTHTVRSAGGCVSNCLIESNGADKAIEMKSAYACIISNNVIIGAGTDIGIEMNGTTTLINAATGNRIYNFNDGIKIVQMPGVSGYPYIIQANSIYDVATGINNADTEQTTMRLIGNGIGGATTARYSGFGDAPILQDIVLTADPYVDAANDDLTLNNTAGGGALLRAAGFPINMPYDWANMTEKETYEGAGGGGVLVPQGLHPIGAGIIA